jgi:hypothetical protein
MPEQIGHDEHGIRTYFLPGDPPGRFLKDAFLAYHRSGCKASIVGFDPATSFDLVECPKCGAVDDIQSFDCGGADWCNLFCNNCGLEVPEIRLYDLVQFDPIAMGC